MWPLFCENDIGLCLAELCGGRDANASSLDPVLRLPWVEPAGISVDGFLVSWIADKSEPLGV